MLKGTLKRSKGITLIALVVTIIVLLILAGISISMLMGQNGILNRAAESKREHTVAQEREAIAIAYSASMNVDNIGKVTGLELQNELDKIMKNTAVTENDTDLNILFKDTLHRYTISQDGTITKKDDLTPEEANKIVRILSSNMVLTADGTVKYIGNESLNTTDCTKLNTSDAKIITNNGIIKSAEGYFIDNKGKLFLKNANYSSGFENGIEQEPYYDIAMIYNIFDGKKLIDYEEVDNDTYMVLDSDGKIYSWGRNYEGQLGNGTNTRTNNPMCISDISGSEVNGKRIKQIRMSDRGNVLAIDDSGKVYAWGDNSKGQLGNGLTDNKSLPICISDLQNNALNGKKIEKIFLSDANAFALDNNGKLYSWGGGNFSGQLGNGSSVSSKTPMCISDMDGSELKGKKIVNVILNYYVSIALDENGKVYVWGDNSKGQLGIGNTENQMLPICLNDLTGHIFYGKKITNITIAEDTNTIDFMACDYEGNAYVWGKNDQGQLCTGDSVDRQTPIILNQIENSIFYNQKITQEYNYIWDKGVGYESLFNYFLLDNGEIYYKFYNVGLPV
ncbi:MAG: hypothetical protein V8R39_06315 [Clostridia bacterium]